MNGQILDKFALVVCGLRSRILAPTNIYCVDLIRRLRVIPAKAGIQY